MSCSRSSPCSTPSGSLRRALTDPTRPAADRTRLADSLLQGKVSPATLDLLGKLAGARWSSPADLATATEQLAVLAAAAAASEAGQLDDVEDELFRFGQLVAANPQLRSALSSPVAPAELKRRLLDTLLARQGDRHHVAPGHPGRGAPART